MCYTFFSQLQSNLLLEILHSFLEFMVKQQRPEHKKTSEYHLGNKFVIHFKRQKWHESITEQQ